MGVLLASWLRRMQDVGGDIIDVSIIKPAVELVSAMDLR